MQRAQRFAMSPLKSHLKPVNKLLSNSILSNNNTQFLNTFQNAASPCSESSDSVGLLFTHELLHDTAGHSE